MANNPPSFRFAYAAQLAKLPPEVQQAHRAQWDAITDLYQASAALKTQLDAKTGVTAAGTAPAAAAAATASETVIIENVPGTVTSGSVNNQTGVTAYTVQQSDNAGLVVLGDASPIAITLKSTLSIPYYVTVSNQGASAVTLTPSTGTVNGGASITLAAASFATLFLDGTNWWADPTIAAGGGGPLRGTVTVAASGASGTFTGTGTITGAGTGMVAVASAPGLIGLCANNPVSWSADVLSPNTVEVQVTLPVVISVTWSNIVFQVAVFA